MTGNEAPWKAGLSSPAGPSLCLAHKPSPAAYTAQPHRQMHTGPLPGFILAALSVTSPWVKGQKKVYLVQIMPILAENQSQIKTFQEILLRFACEHCNRSSSALCRLISNLVKLIPYLAW